MGQVDISALDPQSTVVVATGNAHKVAEIEAILAPVMPGVAFYALGELGDFPDPVENGDAFSENAIIKAQAALEETGLPAVADDSGLVVDALGGEPGIMSARWAGVHGDDARNNAKLMREMEGVADADRTARFHSSVVLVRPDGIVVTGEGDCEGMIGFEPRGEHGFGYDPLFWPADTPGRTMAELEPAEKNAISHRARALAQLAERLG
ncbi:RdgB/HAM1 family non-canonical purine NTP pyrophosphatase [Olsenella uli]|uniref:RdgB/HAM1 family non-canonical purine NTP pyrophosphatase n=1 Tax=Olsenella uli TaxID=133926 RepID=UPI0012AC4ADB|nr:RdgB/HAM1 family non-canonical purine NTP pyrophosphatase [Olsenella uli]